ncbi:uncharacterized protein LOC144174958 [Haemaphysalis longicornis]
MKAVFLLALICAVAYANDEEQHSHESQEQQEQHEHHHHHHHHGHHNHSVCQLNDEHLQLVLDCVGRNLTAEVNEKLNQVRAHLECETVLCGIRKVCHKNGGTLEGGHRDNQTSVFSEEDNRALRAAFYNCRPDDAAHAHLAGAAPATEAPTEA